MAAWAISALRNLKVTKSVASPSFNMFAVDPAPAKTGDLKITVGIPTGFDWGSIAACAAELGVTLPSLNSVVGRVVTWTLTPVNGVPTTAWCTGSQSCDLVTQDPSGTDASLRTDHTASFAYTTNTESPDQHSRGAAITTDSILVRATVSLDTTKLSALIKGLILGSVPGRVGVVVGPMFKALTSSVLQQIASLAQPTFFRYVLVDHHASPARLASRSCTGLFVAGDFPGEDGQVESGGGNLSVCDFYCTGAGCSSQINDTLVQLEISPNATEAHLSFLTNQTEFAVFRSKVWEMRRLEDRFRSQAVVTTRIRPARGPGQASGLPMTF